jgi:2-succinyl-6-hydroxy-2,4-cyclohexadiene-1-carboxylate synthase
VNALCLHGFLGAPASWDDLIDPAERVAPWLAGHGPTPESCCDGFEDTVAAFARTLPVGPPRMLVGYSMGARIGLMLLATRPELFRGAVLIGLHPGLRTPDERRLRCAWESGLRRQLLTEGLEAFVDRWEALPVLRPARPLPEAKRERRRALRLGHTVRGIGNALGALGLAAMPSLWDAIPHIRVPVRLLAGASDPKYCALARDACRRNAAWSFEVVDGAAHDVGLEVPAAVLSALKVGGKP